MTDTTGCPLCGYRRIDEYTHGGCPPGSTPDDHRHLVCTSKGCEYEWVEPVATAAMPEGVGS